MKKMIDFLKLHRRRVLLYGILALLLLSTAGTTVYLLRGSKRITNEDAVVRKLYWNIDGKQYLNSETGLSSRPVDKDRVYRVTFAVDGEHVTYEVENKRLIHQIDNKTLMGLEFNEEGVVVGVLNPRDVMADEVASSYFVMSIEDDKIVTNGMQSGEGIEVEVPLTKNTNIWNMKDTAEFIGEKGTPVKDDVVRAFVNAEGEVSDVFIIGVWRECINIEDYEPFLAAGADLIRVLALAPEREGVLKFVQTAKKIIPNVKFAVGHSEASPTQIEALVPYGLCIGVHHTNATGDLPKYLECRGVCVDETVNYNDNIYAELISDSLGVHVDPYMQRLIRKIKGDKKIILISDQTSYAAINPKGYEHIKDINFTYTKDGDIDITGSKLTLNEVCRNYMKHTGASIVDAFRVASYNPAKTVGLLDRGEIREGLRADLVITDYKMNIQTVILNGKIQ